MVRLRKLFDLAMDGWQQAIGAAPRPGQATLR